MVGREASRLSWDSISSARRSSSRKKYGYSGQNVGNGLQTNGILIDKEWAQFLGEYQFLIGLSLDGPQHIHDHYRLNKGGQPTWEQVVKVARLLMQHKVAVNGLCVVNDYSSRFPDEIYDFYKSIGLRYMQFIPCVEADPDNPEEIAPFTVAPELYGKFLCRLFDRWMKDFKNGLPTTSVRLFDAIFFTYVGMTPPDCTLMEECGSYVVVEHNGDVYACDFFVEEDWKLGNVMEGNLLEMLNSPRQAEFGQRKTQLPSECPSCRWLRYCWGGCPKERMNNPRAKGSNHLCRAFQIFYEHAHDRFTLLAERWLKQHAQ